MTCKYCGGTKVVATKVDRLGYCKKCKVYVTEKK